MAQYLRPASDINTVWTCSTGTARYALIDEVTADDADYIYGKDTYQECKLSSGVDPVVNTGHSIKVRMKTSTNPVDGTVTLVQGTTSIKSSSLDLTTTITNFTITLSEAEAGNITDYTNLRLRFVGAASDWSIYVYLAYMEIPDAPATMGLELGCAF